MMNLPMVNYNLYRDALARQMTGKPLDNAEVVNSILETYYFMGSIINEAAPFAVDEGHGPGNSQARLINLCVRGRQTTFNVWGDIKDGDQLYLKLTKKVVAGTDYALDIHNYGTNQAAGEGARLVPRPLRR